MSLRWRWSVLEYEYAAWHRDEVHPPWEQASHNQARSEIQPLGWQKPLVRNETVQLLPGLRLTVWFNDGLAGVYPVEPERRGGGFQKLLE